MAVAIVTPQAAQWYTCIAAHVSSTGTFYEGDRLKGNHADVTSHPEFWLDDGTDPAIMRNAAQERKLK